MEQNFQTSFIPKKPVMREDIPSSNRPVSLFLVISFILLFFVILLAVGLYFYRGILNRNLATAKTNLALEEQRFEPERISQLQTLDRRLQAGTELLNAHTVITPIFSMLENVTLKTVRYKTFSYERDAGMIKVSLSGEALGYRSVALQEDLFSKNKNMIDPVFSNLNLDQSGNVVFDLSFTVDPSLTNYRQSVAQATP